MRIEEFGNDNDKILIMLHGAYFVHTFGQLYPLKRFFHIIVPHIMGFGNDTDRTFDADICIKELAEYIKSLNAQVYIIGFSLGAQLAYRLVCEYPELFHGAMFISPHLIKDNSDIETVTEQNLKLLRYLKNRIVCNLALRKFKMPGKARREFVKQMQFVSEQTVINCINNNISFDTVHGFENISVPMVAIAGQKEAAQIQDSVKQLAKLNPKCRTEIWKKASHNIPFCFSDKLLTRIIVNAMPINS